MLYAWLWVHPIVSTPRLSYCETFQCHGQRIKHQEYCQEVSFLSVQHSKLLGYANLGKWVWWMKQLKCLHFAIHKSEQEVPIKKTLACRASSPTSPPCPRPLAVLFWGAAWESPLQQWMRSPDNARAWTAVPRSSSPSGELYRSLVAVWLSYETTQQQFH